MEWKELFIEYVNKPHVYAYILGNRYVYSKWSEILRNLAISNHDKLSYNVFSIDPPKTLGHQTDEKGHVIICYNEKTLKHIKKLILEKYPEDKKLIKKDIGYNKKRYYLCIIDDFIDDYKYAATAFAAFWYLLIESLNCVVIINEIGWVFNFLSNIVVNIISNLII